MDQAMIWIKKSADNNYPEAQHLLGYCYEIGEGIEQDLVKAIEFYRKAATNGYEDSIEKLEKIVELLLNESIDK
jgi:TPR repeat protein